MFQPSAPPSASAEPRVVSQGSVGRLYLTRRQAALAARIAGQTRLVWNHFVALNRDLYAAEGRFAFYKEMNAQLPAMRASDPRLAGGLHRPLQMAIMSLDRALKDCARAKGSARKGFPRFRRREERRDGFQLAGSDVKPAHLERDETGVLRRIRLPALGWVRVRGLRLPEGAKQWRFTIRETAPRPNGTALWAISANIDAPAPAYAAPSNPAVGIDVGLTCLAALSDGSAIPALRQRAKLLKRQRRLNRERDRRRKGSVNRRRTMARLARLHRRAAWVRADHLHKASHHLVSVHEGIALETLSARGLMRTRMAGSMSDAGLAELRRQIAYKAAWAGRITYEHPTFQRSTGVCPECHLVGPKLPLSVREWTCQGCDAVHHRDTAAARVILGCAIEAWGASAQAKTVGRASPEPPRVYEGKRAFAVRRGPGDPSPDSAGGPAANVLPNVPASVALFGG